jgi:hypothetical protein
MRAVLSPANGRGVGIGLPWLLSWTCKRNKRPKGPASQASCHGLTRIDRSQLHRWDSID